MQAPFGSWSSPITADLIVAGSIGLGGGRHAGDLFFWQEARPREGGRVAIVCRKADGETVDITPAPFNARTRVHEYGGAAWTVVGETVYFVNFADQQLYAANVGGAPRQVTHEPTRRFANAVHDVRHNRLVCVVESHGEGESEPENYLGAIDLDSGEVETLASGHDFFSSPSLSPDGASIAWMTWDHPDMPWDSTQIWLARIGDSGALEGIESVAGGSDIAAQQPRFSPAGELWYISDDTGWWNLYRYRHNRGEIACEREAEFGVPHWQFGMSTYDFDADGNIICIYSEHNESQLARLDVASGTLTDIKTPFESISGLSVAGNRARFIGASATMFPSLIELDLTTGDYGIARQSSDLSIDVGYFSVPESITFSTADGDVAHGFFYPPANKDFEPVPGEKPPLIVMLHGGPTSASSRMLSLSDQFWTSRGFAVLDLNYRGSTGYGRDYRNKLRHAWGVADVDDAVYGASDLANRGLVDAERLAIRGGSAGGYTTLAALTFRDTFRAGASHFGIGDLEALARDTHKFESRYLDSMIGRYPEEIARYKARSPINHVEHLRCPTIFFQGLEDKVVPPNQAEAMVEALDAKGIPCAYVPFEGEQHGFRRAENIKRALELELFFYGRVFGFEPADEIEPIPIRNLSP